MKTNATLIATEQAAERLERAAEILTERLLRVEARMLAAAELLAKAEAPVDSKPAKVS